MDVVQPLHQNSIHGDNIPETPHQESQKTCTRKPPADHPIFPPHQCVLKCNSKEQRLSTNSLCQTLHSPPGNQYRILSVRPLWPRNQQHDCQEHPGLSHHHVHPFALLPTQWTSPKKTLPASSPQDLHRKLDNYGKVHLTLHSSPLDKRGPLNHRPHHTQGNVADAPESPNIINASFMSRALMKH